MHERLAREYQDEARRDGTAAFIVGVYWEIFEWFFVGKYTMADTISDLLVASIGA